VARGFESKDIEFQQAEAERLKARGPASSALTIEDRDVLERRRTLELALARTRAQLAVATSSPHRGMLEQAIAALTSQIERLKAISRPGT
jgi:uncharacterized small protein (DUF1192 family)